MKKLLALMTLAAAMAVAPVHAKDDKGPAAAGAAAQTAPTPATPAAAAKAAADAGATKPKVELLDINSASADELKTLPGIGDARAEAIIKGRPYRSKDQLVDRKILTRSVYDKIKGQIIARQK